MPIRPKSVSRPWIVKQDYNIAGQGRRIVNPFYQSNIWRHVSRQHKRDNPLCVECLKRGLTVAAKVVDHVKPVNPANVWDLQGGKYGHPIDPNNFQSLCESCHNSKSGRERHNKV